MKLTPEDQKLHKQFSEYGQNAREWMRKCVLLLPEIDRRQIWKKKKCISIYEYAAKLAGMSKAVVDEALWVLKKVEGKPELMRVVEEKGFRRVRPIAALITTENTSFWAEKAKSMSTNTLETYVKNYREEFIHMNKAEPEKLTVSLTLPLELARELQAAQKQEGFTKELQNFLKEFKKKGEQERPKPVQTSSRYIPKRLKDYAEGKTSGLCAYPSCSRAPTSLHHTQRFALERIHDCSRLQPLCMAHERLAHLGLIENEEAAPAEWHLRKEPDKSSDKYYVDTLVSLYRSSA